MVKIDVGLRRLEEVYMSFRDHSEEELLYDDCSTQHFTVALGQGITLPLGIDRQTVHTGSDSKLCCLTAVAHFMQ